MLNGLPPRHKGRIDTEYDMREIDARISAVRTRVQTTHWNRPATLPSELPPEIQRLQECKTFGIPVSIVMDRSSVLLPCVLSGNYEVVYLGFFRIQESQVTV